MQKTTVRDRILKTLKKRDTKTADVAKALKTNLSHTSRTLAQLAAEKKIVQVERGVYRAKGRA